MLSGHTAALQSGAEREEGGRGEKTQKKRGVTSELLPRVILIVFVILKISQHPPQPAAPPTVDDVSQHVGALIFKKTDCEFIQ